MATTAFKCFETSIFEPAMWALKINLVTLSLLQLIIRSIFGFWGPVARTKMASGDWSPEQNWTLGTRFFLIISYYLLFHIWSPEAIFGSGDWSPEAILGSGDWSPEPIFWFWGPIFFFFC